MVFSNPTNARVRLKKHYKARKATTKIAKLSKQVKHLVKLEKEAIAYDINDSTLLSTSTSGSTFILHPAVPASFAQEADVLATNPSYKCNFLYLKMRLSLYNGTLGAATNGSNGISCISPTIRVIIYQDWANKQATPAVTDVLEAATIWAPYNMANSERFKIKYDKLHTINIHNTALNGANFEYNTESKHVIIKLKLAKNKTIEYVALTNSVASAQKGQLFYLSIQDYQTSLVTGGCVPQYRFTSHLAYETL